MDFKLARQIVICGPTASGKSKFAINLALKINGIIVNFDSQQLYKELPIMTAQPSLDDQKLVPHNLYSILFGHTSSNVAVWLEHVKNIIKQYPNQPIIFVGGTGMYLNALLFGLSPIPNIPDEIRNNVRNMALEQVIIQLGENENFNDHRLRRRLEVKLATGKDLSWFHRQKKDHFLNPLTMTIFNNTVPRETTYWCINNRFDNMLKNGGMEEIEKINNDDLYIDESPIMKACGVKEIISYLNGENNIETAIEKAKQSTRNYAKRQMTWFRNKLPPYKIDIDNASMKEILNNYKI